MKLCDVCHGRGEVSADAGHTGFVVTGRDPEGRELGYPTVIHPNRYAGMLLDVNPLVHLWSVAICNVCGGCGLHPSEMGKLTAPQT